MANFDDQRHLPNDNPLDDLIASPAIAERVVQLQKLFEGIKKEYGPQTPQLSISQLLYLDQVISDTVLLKIKGVCAEQSTPDTPIVFFDHCLENSSNRAYTEEALLVSRSNSDALLEHYIALLIEEIPMGGDLDQSGIRAYDRLLDSLDDNRAHIAASAGAENWLTQNEIVEELQRRIERSGLDDEIEASYEAESTFGQMPDDYAKGANSSEFHGYIRQQIQEESLAGQAALVESFCLAAPPDITRWTSMTVADLYEKLKSQYPHSGTGILELSQSDRRNLAIAAVATYITEGLPIDEAIENSVLDLKKELEHRRDRSEKAEKDNYPSRLQRECQGGSGQSTNYSRCGS